MAAGKPFECYYGQSGTGKSESIAAVIRHIYRETGQTARVLIGDGSGATYAALVEAGIVEMTDYTTRDWPLSTLSRLCQGEWPENVDDPKSKLVPMTPEQFKKIGVYVIEGLSVAANYVMGDKKGGFAWRGGRGEKIGQDSPISITDFDKLASGQFDKTSGPGDVFGGNSLAHYGVAQKRVMGFVEQSKGLPGWVIWTAHERAAEDKVSGVKLIGPEVAGGALTANLSRHFNDTLHFATAEKTDKVTDDHTKKQIDVIDAEYRIYTRDHFRPEGNNYVKYKAVSRHPMPNGLVTGEDAKGNPIYDASYGLPLYFEDNNPGDSIIKFYRNVKRARQAEIDGLKPKAA